MRGALPGGVTFGGLTGAFGFAPGAAGGAEGGFS